EDWLEAARRSPVYPLAVEWGIALPLHPEYRTLPMVWYVPPLSPIVNRIEGEGATARPDDIFPAIDQLRIPIQYLANLLAAGDAEVVRGVLRKLAALRTTMRARNLGLEPDPSALDGAGLTLETVERMYRLLALAKYEERFVVPPAHKELAEELMAEQGSCGLDFAGGPGGCGAPLRGPEGAGPSFRLAPGREPA
ncbi:MAG: hypothetical protein K6U79_10510, partial [Firmicutes bacterium]|nr:hypothetical protein [Bacillota bacterium]